jgi:S1-C subfamily serine protease
MTKPALYSSAHRPGRRGPAAAGDATAPSAARPARAASTAASAALTSAPAAAAGEPAATGRLRRFVRRHERALLLLAGVGVALVAVLAHDAMQPKRIALKQEHIDRAVLHTLETKTLPSRAARAAELVMPAVVRVQGYNGEENDEPGSGIEMQGVGSGVVIVDNGIILTNLHVVAGAKHVTVRFFDGSESAVDLVRAFPENDLAVIKAKKVPDDLEAATLGSTANLRPGDEVVAVGFPFGIGPSTSAGVVSGLDRSFKSPEGKQTMTGLIQFDAAANPGNSGGPLISMDGEVLGIVTAILNPTPARTFIGIGFAATIESAGGAVGIPPF